MIEGVGVESTFSRTGTLLGPVSRVTKTFKAMAATVL